MPSSRGRFERSRDPLALAVLVAIASGCLAVLDTSSGPDTPSRHVSDAVIDISNGADTLSVDIRPADAVDFPGPVDSNSPAWWDEQWGLVVINSEFEARGSAGADVFHLGPSELVAWNNQVNGGRWMEAAIPDADGVVYGWYHNEPFHLCCTYASDGSELAHSNVTAPQIGAARSFDAGGTWEDLGIVLSAPPDTLRCDSVNTYFGGGTGDLSVMLDGAGEYLYFYFTSFAGEADEQGVSVGFMPWALRDQPVVKKYRDGHWHEPGLGGRSTPLWPAQGVVADRAFDVLWGAALHYNIHVQRYVMLLNRAQGPDFGQEGVYLSFNETLDAHGWSEPKKIVDGGQWYPQVIGVDDKLAGQVSRFFMLGHSEWEIELSWRE
jgi:hypothetical protein